MQPENKTLAVHQPNFIPWLGYFQKIFGSNVFVILDNVQIPRGGSVANRNVVKGSNGKIQLSVPISHPKGSDKKSTYNEVRIADNKWKRKAMMSIQHSYSKCHFFDEIYTFLESWLNSNEAFSMMNVEFIKNISKRLELNTKIMLQSELKRNEDLQKSEMIIDFCQYCDANIYLSGHGAATYNDPDLFEANGIELQYQNFKHPEYPQLHGDFVSHLSVVDALFNVGFEGTSKLIKES